MQINRIQSNNYNSQPNFSAKLKIDAPWRNIHISKAKNTELIEKAKKIGLENDVIEFSFGVPRIKSEDYYSGQDNCRIADWRVEKRNKLKAIFTQDGKEKENISRNIVDSDGSYFEQYNMDAIESILDDLYKKYPNDIWG